MSYQIRYNSPVILTFSLLALLILVLDHTVWRGLAVRYFSFGSHMRWDSAVDWFRLFSHVLGHANWAHLVGNLSFLLLLGPILEEKYGSRAMLFIVLITAAVTGLLNLALTSVGVMGASGIVFMLIVLASMVDLRAKQIPLTFLLVATIYIGGEIVDALGDDDISQLSHIAGGALGAVIGFVAKRGRLPGGPVF